jgi:L-iditol 2-dehydrogenase
VSLDSAALLEPLSVAIHAVRRSTIEQGDTVVVYGAGTVGLLVAAMAKLSGATTVLISDVDTGRVEYALHNGFATKGYVNSRTSPLTELADKFNAAKETASDVIDIACAGQPDPEGADVTFDCTGKEICMQAGLYVSLSIVHLNAVRRSTDKAIDYKTWRSVGDGRNGDSHPNLAVVCSTPERN